MLLDLLIQLAEFNVFYFFIPKGDSFIPEKIKNGSDFRSLWGSIIRLKENIIHFHLAGRNYKCGDILR